MTMESMIEATLNDIKENLILFFNEHEAASLTPRLASVVTEELQSRSAQLCRVLFGGFLESKEEARDIIVVDGETFRFKQFATKACLGVFGGLEVLRKLFQNGDDTKSYAPMDAAWGMQDEYLTMELREAVAFGCAHVTPEETVAMLRKVLPRVPHATQVKRALENIAACIAPRREAVDSHIRAQETVPEETRTVVASMDGVNVLLNEPGVKQGRPPERPMGEKSKKKPTSYKNAMVGSFSFYGEVKGDAKCPERLDSRYVSHMPEERAVAFKAKFEAELMSWPDARLISRRWCSATAPATFGPTSTATNDSTASRSSWTIGTPRSTCPWQPRRCSAKGAGRPRAGTTNTERSSRARTAVPRAFWTRWTTTRAFGSCRRHSARL